jgi:hypothetical protein
MSIGEPDSEAALLQEEVAESSASAATTTTTTVQAATSASSDSKKDLLVRGSSDVNLRSVQIQKDHRILSSGEDNEHHQRLRHGEWHQVDYKGVGHTVLQLDLNEPCAIFLKVVEVGNVGGRFQVRDGPDHILGLTSQGRDGFCDDSDPDECYERSDAASSGEFALEPGPHNVQLRVVSAPFSRGQVAVRIDREMCPETSR